MKTELQGRLVIYKHTGEFDGFNITVYSFSSDPYDRTKWLKFEQFKFLVDEEE
jgi:hypothetical protein